MHGFGNQCIAGLPVGGNGMDGLRRITGKLVLYELKRSVDCFANMGTGSGLGTSARGNSTQAFVCTSRQGTAGLGGQH
jgi:hypothetical protein